MPSSSYPQDHQDRSQGPSALRREELALRKALLDDDSPETAPAPRGRFGLSRLAVFGATLAACFGASSALS